MFIQQLSVRIVEPEPILGYHLKMVTKHRSFACSLLFSLLGGFCYSQDFDYSKYRPRTLAELSELNSPAPVKDEKKLVYISGNWFYSEVRMRYLGTSRPLTVATKEILSHWKTSFQIPDQTVALFKNEFLFRECDRDVWLPVQEQVSSYFAKELKPGDMVTLYLFLAGGIRTNGKMELLFLVNEFEK